MVERILKSKGSSELRRSEVVISGNSFICLSFLMPRKFILLVCFNFQALGRDSLSSFQTAKSVSSPSGFS